MSGSSVMVGIDVASAYVDVVAIGGELPAALSHVGNDADGHSALADGLARLKPELVLMEATGGYEAALACALQAAGLRVAVVNPRMARDFARAMQRLAKTDRIDAATLAEFAGVLARRPDCARFIRPLSEPEQQDLAAPVTRRSRVMRRSRHHTQKTDNHGRITDTVSISERPASVADRAVPGHWEGDLLFGSKNSQIATLVERHTRYAMLVKVGGKDTETVINALIKHARKLPEELYKSLTWDRGTEMADHKRFTLATDIQVYFCDPQNPWQRGSNENTNGLLRQYFPKRTDLSGYSQAQLNAVARRLNERPRKTLNFETPAERFHQTVASIG